MAKKKKLTANLDIVADKSYSCSVSKDYNDTFVIEQELSDADTFIKLTGFSKDIGSLTAANAKAIVIKNISNIAAEILIETYDWRDDSDGEDADVQNSIDINAEATGGGATALRHISLLLPAGDFFYLNTNRLLTYAMLNYATLESAANADLGQIEILPSAINVGNEYKAVKVISGTTYGGGSGILVNDADAMSVSDTAMVVDEGDWFKAGDLLFLANNEIVEVQSVLGHTLTIKRGFLGTPAAVIADDQVINYFFGNEYLPFDTGKCQSNADGRFKQRGAFFGYARTDDKKVDGLVAGSVSILLGYTEGGYLDWGLSGITANGETGLTASTTYTFHVVVDEFNAGGFDSVSSETAIAFTTDASDTTWAGSSNAVLPKIQAVFDEQFYTTSSGLKNKKVTIGIHNGDIRVASGSNHSDTIVGIGNVSGTTPFGVGNFPPLASSVPDLLGAIYGGGTTDTICYGPVSSLPPETIVNDVTGTTEVNSSAFILDDGNGNLLYNGTIVGGISYTTGHCHWHIPSVPNAEFKIWGVSHSAHSGGASNIAGGFNSISGIHARSVNKTENSKLQLLLFG